MAVWEGCMPSPKKVLSQAVSSLQTWRAVHCPGAASTSHGQPSPQAATVLDAVHADDLPAPQLPFRCYVDAGYHANSMKATYGAVLLSYEGEFIAACAGGLPECFSPLMAEALACREVLSWLRNKGILFVHLHTDCSQLHSDLTADCSTFRSYVGFAIDACKATMTMFSRCHISLISRSANVSAHTLATLAFNQFETMYWDFVPPDSIASFLN